MKFKNKEVVEKTINFLLNILIFVFSILLLVSIYTGFQTRIIGNDYANFFGYSLFEVQSGSMEDTINAGDWIIIKLTQKVKRDDVITYKLNDEYITHRIIEIYNGTYITKGDANSGKDAPIDQTQVVGKVVKILPNFGIIRKTLFNPTVLLVLIITLFICNITFNNNKTPISKSYLKDILDKVIVLFRNITKKLNLKFKIKRINFEKKDNEFLGPNDYVMNLQKPQKISNEKEYEQVEKDLEKTALYRIVSVDAHDVNEEYKVLAPKTKTPEEIEEELGKTSLYRIISVEADEVSEKYKKLQSEIKDEPKVERVNDKPKIEKYAELEDELGKTSIFRVISVDADEVSNKTPTAEKKEEDLEKTAHYRYISIDPDEVDNTLLEIAENEMKEGKQKEKAKEQVVEDTKEVVEEDSLTTINLDLLKSKNARRGKNIIDKIMIIKKEEINELIETIVKDDSTYIYRASVKDALITSYTDAKYYNYYGTVEMETRGRNLTSRVKKMMEIVAYDLIDKYTGPNKKHDEIVKKYYEIFILIANLEQARDTITATRAKKEYYKKQLLKYYKDWDNNYVEKLTDKIMTIQKRYADTIDYFLKKLETNTFDLKFNKLSSNKDMFGLELQHNISFSKVYSDYIIDKTYSEGIVAEDKISILLSLLSMQLIDDMMNSNFEKEYVLYIPTTLYGKERKLSSILNLIDNEYAKTHILILIPFQDLIKSKQVVKEYRKKGYKFVLVFNKDDVILKKNRSNLYIVNCLFINKRDANMKSILSSIPEELNDKIIFEDIVEKVGDLGGE